MLSCCTLQSSDYRISLSFVRHYYISGIFVVFFFFFFSSRRRHTRCSRDWSSDVCSSDLHRVPLLARIVGDQVPGDFKEGKEYTVFALTTGDVQVAPLICFEDTIGELRSEERSCRERV